VGTRERQQFPGEPRRECVQVEHAVLEVEPQVHRDLVVPRPPRVHPLAQRAEALGEPELHRRMHILVLRPDDELPLLGRLERAPQRPGEPPVLVRAQQLRAPQSLGVAQAPEDVPAHEARVPRPVVGDGVLEHLPVHRGRGTPQRRRLLAGSHARYSRATRPYSARAATTSGRSTHSSAVCDRRLVPGPIFTASLSFTKTQSLQVGLP
jgi:hypothetical protein